MLGPKAIAVQKDIDLLSEGSQLKRREQTTLLDEGQIVTGQGVLGV